MSGTLCSAGTRVPVKSLFDYLEAGDSLDEFLDQFSTVTHDMAINVLDASKQAAGFTGLLNGELITVMKSAEFDALATFDQNLLYLQNSNLPVAVIVLVAPNN